MQRILLSAVIVAANYRALAVPREIVFSESANSVAVCDYVEVSLRVSPPIAGNPFTDTAVTGSFAPADRSESLPLKVDGFCDSADGAFVPGSVHAFKAGRLRLHHQILGEELPRHIPRRRPGAARANPRGFGPPLPLVWEGTREHFYFNGTTDFWLMGWRDERVIRNSLERLHRLNVNRVRVLLSGRTNTMYGRARNEHYGVECLSKPVARGEDRRLLSSFNRELTEGGREQLGSDESSLSGGTARRRRTRRR